jgi:hypothetical protein
VNDFEWLVEQLKTTLPDATTEVESGGSEGNKWLDVRKGEKLFTVEWRPGQGFGFFAADAGFGEGPNEIVPQKEKALEKIVASFGESKEAAGKP